jgi:hypothetical protein
MWNWLEKGERIDICNNVRLTHSSVCTIRDNADTITESAMSETKVFVLQDYHSLSGMKCTKNYGVILLYFYCIRNKYE